jgi:ribosome-associated heat shock protein Hsp15
MNITAGDATVKSVRIDKWLWAARFFKTRSKATAACIAGHVMVDGKVVKAAYKLVVGEMIQALTPRGPLELEVTALGDKRGPVATALTLYNDHTPKAPDKPIPPVLREPGSGRPTKRDRRLLDKLLG